MRILSLVPSIHDTSPGQRFRLEQWEPTLRQEGIAIDLHPFEDAALHSVIYTGGNSRDKLGLIMRAFRQRWKLVKRVRDYDAVYVFREAALLGPPIIERAIRRSGVPMVFDFDDAIFIPYKSPSNSYLSRLKFPGKTRELCKISMRVMAGNEHLADYARRVNSNVSIVPTTIDTAKYQPQESAGRGPVPVIGWSGSLSTVQHLETLRFALLKLAGKERFRLRVIGTNSYQLDGVEVDALSWRSNTEIDDLRKIDIGIMPLPDDKWSKGKCGLKALQYMALGVPAVCSAVGVNSAIIRHGENGFLATCDDEWVDRLRDLLKDSSLRDRLGSAARKTVVEQYSAEVVAPKVSALLLSMGAQPQLNPAAARPERATT